MKRLGLLIGCVFLIGISSKSRAQQLISKTFGVENGLPTYFTKSIVQDSAGYVYIASDQGITLYNGHSFKTFKQDLPSLFVKHVYNDRSGNILAVTDGGVVHIQRSGQQLHFKLITAAKQSLNDDTIHFPKKIYQSKMGSYWVSEPNSISRLDTAGNLINRYTFPNKDRTTSYITSFNLFEIEQNLYSISQKGTIYIYDDHTDRFTPTENQFFSGPNIEINGISASSGGSVFIATTSGLSQLSRAGDGLLHYPIVTDRSITALTTLQENRLLFSDNTSTLYYGVRNGKEMEVTEVYKSDLMNINQLYSGHLNTIWATSDEGLSLFYESFTISHAFPDASQFSRAITTGKQTNKIYAANNHTVYAVDKQNSKAAPERIFHLSNNLIRSLAVSNSGLLIWTGTQAGHLFRFEKGTLAREIVPFKPAQISTSIVRLFNDSSDNLWIIREEMPGVIRRSNKGEYTYFGPHDGVTSQLTDIIQVDSLLYFSGQNKGSYLYQYNINNGTFTNISASLPDSIPNPVFPVIDLAAQTAEKLYLATANGIYLYQNKHITAVELPPNISADLIRAIEIAPDNKIWLGMENGLYLREPEGFIRHIRHAGNDEILSVEYRSLLVDNSGTLWIGTVHNGLNELDRSRLDQTIKTPKPDFVEITIAGKINANVSSLQLIRGEKITVHYHTIAYPTEYLTYQWRIPQISSSWSSYLAEQVVTPDNLPTGTYRLEVRALHSAYQPSEVAAITFKVQQYWFLRWPYLLLFGAICSVILFGFTAFLKEISRRRLTQSRLQKTENQLQTIISNTPVIIFTINPQGYITMCDGKGLKRIGFTSDFFLGKHFTSIFTGAYYRRKVEEALDGQETRYQNTIKDYNFTTRLHPVKDTENNILQVIGISIDITDRVQIEHELLKAKDEAIQANKAKSQFLANMSHELRTPLNAILGYAQILKRKFGDNLIVQNQLDVMYKSGTHLLNMINEILDLSKIESGIVDIHESVTEIKPLVNDVVDMFRPEVEEKGLFLDLIFHFEDEEIIVTDKNKLRQILINLLKNAINYTDEGAITIMIVTGYENKPNIQISICDTGPGIPEHEQEIIFDAFKQTEHSGTSNKGTGLGLSITKNLVKRLDGTITVTSQMGENSGTCFDIVIPYSKADPDHLYEQNHVDTAYPRLKEPKKVLLADDIPENLNLINTVMAEAGFDTILAQDGIEAVEKFHATNPDLVILDIVMPGMNGREVFRQIQKESQGSVPVIALTASGFDSSREELLKLGFDAYFRKPFVEQRLLAKVVDLMGKEHFSFDYDTEQKRHDKLEKAVSPEDVVHFLRKSLTKKELEAFKNALDFMEWNQIKQIVASLDNHSTPELQQIQKAIDQTNFRFLIELNETFEQT